MLILSLIVLTGAPALAADSARELRDLVTGTQNSATALADKTAEDFLAYLVRVNASLDEKKITKPEHRAAVIAPAANELADSMLAEFDAFGVKLLAGWRKKAPQLSPIVSEMLDDEADRLTEFLRADPMMLVSRAARTSRLRVQEPIRQGMESMAAAVEAADSGPGFMRRLQRAQIVGDREVARVVRRRVGREAQKVGDRIADAYLTFFLASQKSLNESAIYDSAARRSILEPQSKAVSDSMLADFDAFTVATKQAFAGAGEIVPVAATAALDEGETPDGSNIRRALDMQAKR
ncbi:MAG: hypothetical protein A3G34_00430 [Candidatus Lindowbacteria bacterium RIFCSPLOWO2_12_FULL_62_27]|nr:MAG: hypothetical protein A3G34_00430 [Candidatus Lindowbacteria bacterium RIFCSPLOWO2_12_FULL_62_27]OGH63413.1 MAG: hypothetical protein A3I06_08510 [Candidatus Lindowbacteria bacterium RIFCSPLOWO2_02_FULL_62_12]